MPGLVSGRGAAWPVLAALLLTLACAPPASLRVAQAPASPPLCAGAGLRVYADFEEARVSGCSVGEDGRVRVAIRPEAAKINPSPWYAMRIEGPDGVRPILELGYDGAAHRYRPWAKGPDGSWTRLPDTATVKNADGSATIRLPALAGPTIVSAQPLDPIADALAPWQALAARGRLATIDAGPTPDGRPLPIFLHTPRGAEGLVVLVARQHPPEKTGALAFDSFAARIFADTRPARSVRKRFAIMVVPVLNPDGIARGNWRGNSAGADLNRDWGPFAQPETRAAGARIEALAASLPPVAIVDFHSTVRDVIYAPPRGPGGPPADAAERFLDRFAATPEGPSIPVSRSHTPSAGTLKGWSRDRFGIAGLTYEVGDSSERSGVKATATVAADAFLDALAEHPPPPRKGDRAR